MAKKSTAKDKKIKALIFDLRPGDVKRQIKAVKSLRVHGNESVILPLLDVLVNSDEDQLKQEITETLYSVKYTAVPKIIAGALNDVKYESIREILLASVWNSGLDYRPYLADIVKASVKGEMMDALECITIIENIEGTLSEEQLFDAQLVLKEYLVENKDESSKKMDILKEVSAILQEKNDAL